MVIGEIQYPTKPSHMTRDDWVRCCTRVKPEFVPHFDPEHAPFRIGDVVMKGAISRPADLCQRFRVKGLYYSGSGNGWFATLAYGESNDEKIIPDEHITCSTTRLCLCKK